MIDTEIHNRLRYREKEGAECPTLNGTAILHPFLPRLKDHAEYGGRKTPRARGRDQTQGSSVLQTHRGSCTHELTVVFTALDKLQLDQITALGGLRAAVVCFPLRAATIDCCFPETMKSSQATGHLQMFTNPQCWSLRSPKQNLTDCLTLRHPQEWWHYTAYL